VIAYLKGKLCQYQSDSMIVEVGGIGFKVAGSFAAATFCSPPLIGEEIIIYTHLHVREDDMRLYGFLRAGQLHIFQQLLTIPGIGPKGALSIVSSVGAEDLAKAVITEDLPFLTRLPGVGKKTAQRLVIELKDKILKGKSPSLHTIHEDGAGGAAGYYEAIEALESLGYHSHEIMPYLNAAKKELDERADAAQLIAFVLKRIGTT